MARRKGSKNRTTLERELAQAGEKTDLSKLSYEELSSKAETLPRPSTAPVPEPKDKTMIPPEEARAIVDDTRRRFDIMVDYYTSDDDVSLTGEGAFVPERIQEYLRGKVFMAATSDEAHQFARKALDKLHSHLLYLGSQKRISGPNTSNNIQARARKAEKWANRLEELGRKDEARAQRLKVQQILATPAEASGCPWLA